MDHQNVHHVVESVNQLVHDLLNRNRVELPVFALHQFLEVTAVAVLHEDVVAGICLDGFLHLDHVVADYHVLVLDLRHD